MSSSKGEKGGVSLKKGSILFEETGYLLSRLKCK